MSSSAASFGLAKGIPPQFRKGAHLSSTRPLDRWPLKLPTLQCEETLYSWCATYHRRSMGVSALATSQALFGSKYAALRHDFPSHVAQFETATEGAFGNARQVALRHTLLGYFLPFSSRDFAEDILTRVTSGAVPDLKMRLGIPASGIRGYHPLKFCKRCVAQDVEKFGWAIWRIPHQPPSTLVCSRHQRPLVLTWNTASPVHRRSWLLPDEPATDHRAEVKVGGKRADNLLQRMAAISAHAQTLAPGAWRHARLVAVYRHWAKLHGALSPGGSVRHGAIFETLLSDFRIVQSAFQGLAFGACTLDLAAILANTTRWGSTSAHPLKHIALLAAMFESAEDAIRAVEADGNPSTDEPRLEERQDRTDVELSRRDQFVHLVRGGATIRSAATSVGVTTTTGVRWAHINSLHFPSRAKHLRTGQLEAIRNELRAGVERKIVAARNEVSLTTIHRLLSAEHELRDQWANARHAMARAANRTAWLNLLRKHPGASAKTLRKLPSNGWAWLYRHDKSWLSSSLPTLWERPDDSAES
nr:TnsD family transposase [Pseudorhodoferax sp. Leaf274]